MKKIKIINKTGRLHDTKIIDPDTGEKIKNVEALQINVDSRTGEFFATLRIFNPELEIVVDLVEVEPDANLITAI